MYEYSEVEAERSVTPVRPGWEYTLYKFIQATCMRARAWPLSNLKSVGSPISIYSDLKTEGGIVKKVRGTSSRILPRDYGD